MLHSRKFCSIDESGDLGKTLKSSNFFVLTAFIFDDENLNRKIKKLISKIYKKNKLELFHARDNDDNVKIKLVKFLQKIKWSAKILVIKKIKTISKNKTREHLNYLSILKELLSKIDIEEKIYITLPFNEKSHLEKIKQLNGKIEIHTTKSEKSLQIADLIAWSVFKKFEHKDDLYFNLLNKNIEVFKLNEKQNPYATYELN